LAADSGVEAKTWAAQQLNSDTGFSVFVRAFTSESFSQGMGMMGDLPDHVGRKRAEADLEGMKMFFDVAEFRRRLEKAESEATLPEDDLKAVGVLLAAWRRRESGVLD